MPRTLWNECQHTAAQLDKKYPGWHEHVKLQSLNMVSCNVCVLGQIIDQYEDFMYSRICPAYQDYAEKNSLSLKALGLDSSHEDDDYWDKLNKYWETLIRERQHKQWTT